MNSTAVLSGTERQQQIRDLIDRNRRVSVADICEAFAVSEATARRDLETLTEQGLVQRVHGGAIAMEKQQPESPMMQRQNLLPQEKRAIGAATARLIKDGETIFLGSGTTVLAVAQALLDHKDLTVITNSLPVMNILSKTQHTVISLGGALRASELSFIGHVTEQAAGEFPRRFEDRHARDRGRRSLQVWQSGNFFPGPGRKDRYRCNRWRNT